MVHIITVVFKLRPAMASSACLLKRDRHTDRQTDRDRQAYRQTETETERQTHKDT